MKGLLAAAGVVLALASTSARAADLYDDPPPARYSGPAYQDPRYSDVYRYPDRPVPPAPVYRDRDDDYVFRPRQRHAYRGECLPRHVIKDRLVREGWGDFALGDFHGELVTVHARRPSGRPFTLTIERCSGEIVDARPSHAQGPYAYAPTPPPPRRWDRPYY